MASINNLRSFIIEWNNQFPLDREYRRKFNISFNSPAHRSTCQFDIYMNWLEDQIFEEHEVEQVEKHNKKALYDKGEWISGQKLSNEEEDILFDDFDVSKIDV